MFYPGVIQRKNKSGKIGKPNRFAVAGVSPVICDALIGLFLVGKQSYNQINTVNLSGLNWSLFLYKMTSRDPVMSSSNAGLTSHQGSSH